MSQDYVYGLMTGLFAWMSLTALSRTNSLAAFTLLINSSDHNDTRGAHYGIVVLNHKAQGWQVMLLDENGLGL